MAFPNHLLSNPTWRHIGLGLTGTIFGLGAFAMFAPLPAAETLGVLPTTPEGRDITKKSMIFLGIRDVAVAAALLHFYREGDGKSMGVLTTAFTLVALVDTWVAVQGPRGWDGGIWGLIGGGMTIALVGLGLVQS